MPRKKIDYNIINDNLNKINRTLEGIRDKKHWIERITIFLLIISLYFTAYNTYIILKDRKPFVVNEHISCPKDITLGYQMDLSFLNIGGSRTIYKINVISQGLKCFETFKDIYSIDSENTKKWNQEYNKSVCNSSNYIIDKNSPSLIKLIIFEDIGYHSNQSNFTISYSYILNNNWIKSITIKKCFYNLDNKYGYPRWILYNEE